MRKLSVIACGALALILAITHSVCADTPPAERQLVYALEAFEGVGYASSFAPLSEDTIYLLAGQDNALSPRYTMVYYWPLSRSYRADWNVLNEPVEADSLEILRGRSLIQTTSLTVFSIAFPEGYGSRKSELYWGDGAEERYLRFQEQRKEYYAQMREYRNAMQEYERAYDEYTDAMLDEKIAEKPPAPIRPEEPSPFLLVVTPPTQGFRVNLPSGEYRIRLKGPEGETIPGSEKRLVVFSHRRQGIGYNILPESRWTKPERSDDPQETIYVDGKSNAALYLQPFLEAEFNEAYYRGLLDPQDHSGGEDRWVWAHLEAYGQATMSLFDPGRGGEFSRLEEKPFSVIQSPGPRLGYAVVEHQPETMGGQRPTFTGFELKLTDREGGLTLWLLDSSGAIVEGSEREVRWLPQHRPAIQYLWLCGPLLAGLSAYLFRRSRVKRMTR